MTANPNNPDAQPVKNTADTLAAANNDFIELLSSNNSSCNHAENCRLREIFKQLPDHCIQLCFLN